MKKIATARGVCPNCQRNLPVSKAFWGLGKVFACKGCGAKLYMPKVQLGIAMGATAALIFMSRTLPIWLVLGIAVLLGYLSWLFAEVHQLEEEET